MTDQPSPLAFGLYNPATGKLDPRAYVHEEAALAGALRQTNQWRTFVAIPLFGPDALVELDAQLQSAKRAMAAAQHAENALRLEAIDLRNQLAVRRGQEVAASHAAGMKS